MKKFENPVVDVIELNVEDVITTSSPCVGHKDDTTQEEEM